MKRENECRHVFKPYRTVPHPEGKGVKIEVERCACGAQRYRAISPWRVKDPRRPQ